MSKEPILNARQNHWRITTVFARSRLNLRSWLVSLLVCFWSAFANAAPTVTVTSPTRNVLAPGQSLDLSVSATGSGTVTYQWLRKGKAIAGGTNATLAITNSTYADSGWYLVDVTDSAGTTRSKPIFLTVAPVATQVRAWGDNNEGQTNVPSGLTDVIGVSAGWYQNLALKRNGAVVKWGGPYGNDPINLSDVVQVATGYYTESMALKSDGTVVTLSEFTPAPPGLADVVSISAGSGGHKVALKSNGTVVAWGANQVGQTDLPAGLNNVVAISAGGSHSLALKGDGTVVAWGYNTSGQTTVPVGLTGVVAIATSSTASYALKADGAVIVWGDSSSNQLIVPVGLNATEIEAGATCGLAIKSDGTVAKWGRLSISGGIDSLVPSELDKVFAISAGSGWAVALRDGTADLPPSFTVQPISQSAVETQRIVLSASTTGIAPLSYQWRKGGTNIAGATASALVLANLALADAGSYDVVVTNYLGSATSSAAIVTVNPLVGSITALSAARQVLNLGQNLNLSISATGAGALSYQWTRNGLPLAGATGSSCSRTNVTFDDSGWYSVLVSDTNGTRRSASFFVSVSPQYTQVRTWSAELLNMFNFPETLTNVIDITAGNGQIIALKSDGKVIRGGPSYDGWVTWPDGLTGVVDITAGALQVLALKEDGTVAVWGGTGYGEDRVPANLNNVVALAGGYGFSLALKNDGSLAQWGGNITAAPPVVGYFVGIAAGGSHALGLRSDGKVIGWGSNLKGQLDIPSSLTNVVSVAASYYSSFALKSDGTVVAWGDNTDYITEVPVGLTNVIAISAEPNGNHVMAVKSDGKVVVWGSNDNGQKNVPAELNNVFKVAAGYGFSVALRDAESDLLSIISQPSSLTSSETQAATFNVAVAGGGTFKYQWRKNGGNITGATSSALVLTDLNSSAAGNYDVVVSNYLGSVTSAAAALVVNPSPVVTSLSQTRNVLNAGQSLSLSVSAIGTGSLTYQWTRNGHPISGATSSTLSITSANLLDTGYYIAFITDSVGTRRSSPMFVTVAGVLVPTQLRQWGYQDFGTFAVPFDAGLRDIFAVNGGTDTHSLAVRTNGKVVGWGSDGFGAAYPPDTLGDVVKVAAGYRVSYALKKDGTVSSWGDNFYGQRNIPVGLSSVVDIATSFDCTLALKSDGTVVQWGSNTSGGGNVPEGLQDVVAIASSTLHSLALKGDGTVVAWGKNDTEQSNVPANLVDVVSISAGGINSGALKSDGTVIVWGADYTGLNAVPAGLINVKAISLGSGQAFALRHDGTVVAWGRDVYGDRAVPTDLTDVVQIDAIGMRSLALVSAPIIRNPPLSQVVNVSASHTLSIVVEGSTNPSYQWQKNGVNIGGATASIYALPNVSMSDAGDYRVVVTNSIGSVTSNVGTLTAIVAPPSDAVITITVE